MAFLECCYEAKLILDLWICEGPSQFSKKISPTAFYGGWTRGKRLVTEDTKNQMRALFDEIREGRFSKEWEQEASLDYPQLKARLHQQKGSLLEKTYFELKNLADLNPNS
jgi:ketol-acid reductoisomerase